MLAASPSPASPCLLCPTHRTSMKEGARTDSPTKFGHRSWSESYPEKRAGITLSFFPLCSVISVQLKLLTAVGIQAKTYSVIDSETDYFMCQFGRLIRRSEKTVLTEGRSDFKILIHTEVLAALCSYPPSPNRTESAAMLLPSSAV